MLQQHVFDWVTDAEKNQPYVAGGGRDAFGRPISTKLVVTEGWRKLQEFSIEKGYVFHPHSPYPFSRLKPNSFVAQGYEAGLDQYTRIVQYLRQLLFESSSANVGCPGAMADGAARVLQHHLRTPSKLSASEQTVFRNAYDHLTSRDPTKAWTSGQWMTERIGGSDVSRSETTATYAPLPSPSPEEGIPPGPWRIDGFKWFSSATDSNMTMLLAQTANGLSAFYAPLKRRDGALNGVSISRLKNKMGTKPLPTAELQLRGMRAWLVGREGDGVKEVATILTITRVRSALSALGHVSRGLSVARAFAEAREVGAGRGRRVRLVDSALHVRSLADMVVEQHGMMLLTFYSAYLLGLEEHSGSARGVAGSVAVVTPPAELVTPLLRVVTPLLKAYVTKQAIPLVYACMEALGGVGYLENSESEHMNLARLFRDACVLNIWEGTTDVLSTDLIRALKHPKGGADSIKALDLVISRGEGDSQEGHITKQWTALKAELEANTQEDLLQDARRVLWKLAEILMGVLFLLDVKSNDGPTVREMCRRYLVSRGLSTATETIGSERSRGRLELNRAIVFGDGYTATGASKL